MKKLVSILASVTLAASLAVAGEQFSMSDADRALYQEMLENNPADIFVEEGSEYFDELVTEEALAKFLGVTVDDLPKAVATFPRYIPQVDEVLGLDQVMQAVMHLNGHKPFKLKSPEMFAMLAYAKSLANDEPVAIDVNANKKMKESYRLGEKVFMTKRGGRGLSCNSCHAREVVGLILRTQPLPDLGDVNAGGTWPAYRMTKSSLRTLQRRFQGCMKNALLAVIPIGSREMVALEVYVTELARQKGKKIAIPGLKR
ncbi:sulfur oxidation c-type cytochrome SoxA [Hydrogenimonas sp.]